MASAIVPASLASATLADLQLAERYIGPATWIGEPGDGDARKIVFELVDGTFETFTVGELRMRAWWRLGRPEDVVAIEALMSPGRADDAEQRARRARAVLADQVAARARLATA